MNLQKLITKEVNNRGGRIPRSKKMIAGKILMIYAALPLLSAWAFIPGLLLSMPMSPALWARDKMNQFKGWMRLI